MSSTPSSSCAIKPGTVGKCPHCAEKLRFEDALFDLYSRVGHLQRESSDATCKVHGKKEKVEIYAAACPECGKPIVSIGAKDEEWPAYPRSPLRPVPNEVRAEDKSVAEDYEQASLLLTLSPKASAALGRRCLQAVLVKKANANPKASLNDQIDEVLNSKTNPLPGYIGKNFDAIRNYGNFSAHPTYTTIGEIVDVEHGEAEWTLEILDDLFDHYYVKPQQAARRRDALNKKLKEAGKLPMKSQ